MPNRPGVVRFKVLGPLAATRDGSVIKLGGPRQQRILTALLLAGPAGVTVERLIERAWNDGERPGNPVAPVRVYVNRLRESLEPGRTRGDGELLVTRSGGYHLDLSPDSIDAAEFERLLNQARSTTNPGTALDLVERSLDLWRGDAYGELADLEWLQLEARRLDELRVQAQELALENRLDLGLHAEVIPAVEAMVQLHPFRESLRRIHMLALYRDNRQVEALRSFEEHRQRLVEEMGLATSPSLTELNQQILVQEETLLRPAGRRLRDYQVGERLQSGLDGELYDGAQISTGRRVVIRAIPSERSDNPQFIRDFEVNAGRIAQLEHPNLLDLIDFWREPGHAYLIFRRMTYPMLSPGLVEDRQVEQVAHMARQLAEAAMVALEAGVGLLPFRPDNVAVDAGGNAYLWGFNPGDGGTVSSEAEIVESLEQVLGGLVVRPGVRTLAALLEDLGGATGTGRETASPVGPNPYRGLAAFKEADAHLFFGRSASVARILDMMQGELSPNLVGVVGPSGAGKSSLVRAGVVPALRAGAIPGSSEWYVVTMLPGVSVIKSLGDALDRIALGAIDATARLGEGASLGDLVDEALPAEGDVVLFVDQFEELFTLASDFQEQERFLDLIVAACLEANSRLRVLLTLRADHYDRPLMNSNFGWLLARGTVPLPAMTAAELAEVVEQPAATLSSVVEPALVAAIVADAADRAAALPLVQFALTELWDRGQGNLTLEAYQSLGGLAGALIDGAEAELAGRDEHEIEAVRLLLLSLTALLESGDAAKRRVIISDLIRLPGLSLDLIDDLVRARLLTTDREPVSRLPTVELSHEALLTEWPRLAGWIAESRESLVTGRRIGIGAAAWEEGGRLEADLLRGHRLDAALEWQSESVGVVDDLVAEFVSAGADRRSADEEAARARAEDELRAGRRLRRLSQLAGLVAVIAVVAGVIALVQSRRASSEAASAVAERRAAEVSSVINEGLLRLDTRPDTALLLAAEAFRRDPGLESQRALLATLTSLEFATSVRGDADLNDVDARCVSVGAGPTFHASRGSRGLFSADIPGRVPVSDGVTTSISIEPPSSSDLAVVEACARFRATRGDRTLTAAADWGTVMLEASSGDLIWEADTRLTRALWIDDDFILAKRGSLDSLREWVRVDAATGEILAATGLVAHSLDLSPTAASGLAILTVATGGSPVRGAIVDGTGLAIRHELGEIPQPSLRISFSADGELVGFVSEEDRLLVWDSRTGDRLLDIPAATAAPSAFVADSWFEFNPSGTTIAALNTSGLVTFRSATTGEPVADVIDTVERLLHAVWLDDDRLAVLLESGRVQTIDRSAAGSFAFRTGITCCTFSTASFEIDGIPGPYAIADGTPTPFAFVVGSDHLVSHTDLATGRSTARSVEVGCCPGGIVAPVVRPDGSHVVFDDGMKAVLWEVDGTFSTTWLWGQAPGWDRVAAAAAAGPEANLTAVALIPPATGNAIEVRTGTYDLLNGEVSPPATVVIAPRVGPIDSVQLVDGGGLLVSERLDEGGYLVRELDLEAAPRAELTLDVRPAWVRFAPDGRYALTSDIDNGLQLHRLESGDQVDLDTGVVGLPIFLRDGRFLIEDDREVVGLWDAAAAELIGAVGTTTGERLQRPALAVDESHIWLLSDGEWVRVPLDPTAWARQACEIAGRQLTDEERSLLVPWSTTGLPACGP